MNDGSEATELAAVSAFEIQRLQKQRDRMKAQADDLHRQLTEAWQALEYWAGMDAMEAIKAHHFIMEDDGG